MCISDSGFGLSEGDFQGQTALVMAVYNTTTQNPACTYPYIYIGVAESPKISGGANLKDGGGSNAYMYIGKLRNIA